MIEQLPLLSVIVPVYNAERHVNAAIDSILAEQYPSLEIIAVDDGSTDGSAQILKDYPEITYYYQSNRGPGAARNVGIKQAKGEILLFLDADDLFPKGKIMRQLTLLLSNPKLQLVLGKSEYFFEEGATTDVLRFPDDSYQVHNIMMGAAIFRRSVFDQIGLMEESLRYGEDFDFFNRIREQRIPLLVTDDITLLYRRHSTNMTNEVDVTKQQMLHTLKRSLDRRREGSSTKTLRPLSEYKSDQQ
jgi:glycosyltransferase involved in cell wall biosynthesis